MGGRPIKELLQGVNDVIAKRKLANNTVEYELPDGTKKIRLHDTDIMTFTPAGDCILNSGGWQTPTTKARMNRFLFLPSGAYIRQEKSVWWLHVDGKDHVFQDGICITSNGKVTGAGSLRDMKAMKRQIAQYVDDYCEALFTRQLPAPAAGDCWGCYFRATGNPGVEPMGRDHLISHMEEKYYVPSLAMNAATQAGVSQAARHHLGYLFGVHDVFIGEPLAGLVEKQIEKAIIRYMRKNLGLAR